MLGIVQRQGCRDNRLRTARKMILACILLGLLDPGRGVSQEMGDRVGQISALNRASVQAFRRRDFQTAEGRSEPCVAVTP